jgi:dTDP-4-amino-4,6-dideoxygalactose transaminase
MTNPGQLVVGLPNSPGESDYVKYVSEILKTRRFSNNGPFLQRLEREIEAYLGVSHCVCVANATVGIEMVLRVCGLEGEVILPSFTFIATAHAVSWMGLKPVFAEIRGNDHMIDPAVVEDLITERTSAIMGVHLWGGRCEAEAIEKIAQKYELPVIYDAAHAFGVSFKGKKVGGGGLCEVFSFHATKFFNTFEGGAITTESEDLAAKLRRARSFGFEGMDKVVSGGTNAKLSEAHAAMGVANLPYVESLREANRRTYEVYRDYLGECSEIDFYSFGEGVEPNFQYVVICVPQCRRDAILGDLHAGGVMARRYFYPGAHRSAPYLPTTTELPVTDAVSAGILVLPAGPSISEIDVGRIARIITKNLEQA